MVLIEFSDNDSITFTGVGELQISHDILICLDSLQDRTDLHRRPLSTASGRNTTRIHAAN